MTAPSFGFDDPDHFTVGTVGPAGQRVFYLQARDDEQLVTLKCEKEQVRALADYLGGMLEKLPATGTAPGTGDLIEPVDPVWAVASLGIGHDETRHRIVIVAKQVIEEEGDEPATARFAITAAQAKSFVTRARELMEASRPICPLCSLAMEPGGHVCPRKNGHAAPHA
ncbi:MAG: DUF3090 family protein [Candidatus Rokubacteria bacterium]|nr:DUF3090 family protein [Candidatus Rokubacteria bacterium]